MRFKALEHVLAVCITVLLCALFLTSGLDGHLNGLRHLGNLFFSELLDSLLLRRTRYQESSNGNSALTSFYIDFHAYESVSLAIECRAAIVQRADGSSVTLPLDVFLRCTVLCNALQHDESSIQLSLRLPGAVLGTWWEGLQFIDVYRGPEPAPEWSSSAPLGTGLVQYLQVHFRICLYRLVSSCCLSDVLHDAASCIPRSPPLVYSSSAQLSRRLPSAEWRQCGEYIRQSFHHMSSVNSPASHLVFSRGPLFC